MTVVDFSKGKAYDRSLSKGARAAVKDVLALKKDERLLIITNPDSEVSEISMALFDAALEVGARPVAMYQASKGQFDYAESEVIKAIASEPEAVVSISAFKLGKDEYGFKHGYRGKRKYDHIFDYLYEEARIRTFWSPSVSKDMWRRTVPIDYARLRRDCKKVADMIASSDSVHVTAPGGTDLTLGVKGRKPRPDDGDFRRPGRGGNIPSGEVYVSPALGTTNGTIVFDGSMSLDKGVDVIRTPIQCTVKDGFVVGISGGKEAKALERTVKMGESKARKMVSDGKFKRAQGESYARNARSIGELGIGLNRSARIVGLMLEDEKVYGTCHFAVGSNYDGDAESLIHLDGLVKKPTITVVSSSGREIVLMAGGRLAWD